MTNTPNNKPKTEREYFEEWFCSTVRYCDYPHHSDVHCAAQDAWQAARAHDLQMLDDPALVEAVEESLFIALGRNSSLWGRQNPLERKSWREVREMGAKEDAEGGSIHCMPHRSEVLFISRIAQAAIAAIKKAMGEST